MIQLLQFFLTAWVIIGVLFLLGLIAGVAALFVYVIIALYHIARKHIRDIIEEHRPPKPCETEECLAFRKAFYGPVIEAFRIENRPIIPTKGHSWTISWKGSTRYAEPSGPDCTRSNPCPDGIHPIDGQVGTYDPNDGGVHA